MKKIIGVLRHRITVLGIALLVQLAIIVLVAIFFSFFAPYYYVLSLLISILLIFSILNNRSNPSYQMAWLIPVLLFPIFGGIFYWLLGANKLSKKETKLLDTIERKIKKNSEKNPDLIEKLDSIDSYGGQQARYIQDYTYYPPSNNTKSTYYPTGESFFEAFKEDIAKADSYIFMEFFIFEKGRMWGEILEILLERIDEGVEVRLVLDDIGTLFRIPTDYPDELRDLGIKVEMFNPVKPRMTLRYNMRNHRKIMIIDGKVGYTGGLNMADEYINEIERFGYWKDNAIRIEGEAVWSFSVMFLSLWEFLVGTEEKYSDFRPEYPYFNQSQKSLSVVHPFTDDPTYDEPLAETVYLNMIYKAQESVYIKTPYLVLSNELLTAILNAAKAGIDVKIITPGIPDKKLVYEVTRSYYTLLLDSGVSIYEYSPGFIHEKIVMTDRKSAVIGTINLNYRSTHLDFESGVWLYNTNSVLDMHEEFLSLLPECRQVTLKSTQDISLYKRFKRRFLRLFAPIM